MPQGVEVQVLSWAQIITAEAVLLCPGSDVWDTSREDLKTFLDRFDHRENMSKRCTEHVMFKSSPGHTDANKQKSLLKKGFLFV